MDPEHKTDLGNILEPINVVLSEDTNAKFIVHQVALPVSG